MLTKTETAWAPVEPDWKEFVEPQMGHDSRKFDRAIIETECPGCGRWVGALVVDGPDPAFVDLVCPRDSCAHAWSERVT